MKKVHLLILPCVIFLSMQLQSCGQSGGDNNTQQKDSIQTTSGNFDLGTFTKFPPEIDGCSCYFSADSNDFDAHVYLYADNFKDIAFIRIDSSMVRFELISSERPDKTHQTKIFSADLYELTITIEETGQIDETWQQAGVLVVKRKKDNASITRKILGECGC